MYKVGEKVETPQFTGIIEKVYESGVKVNGKMFPLKDIKPYKSAHEKLIELGWEEKPTTIKNNKRYDNDGDGTIFIDFEEKTYEVIYEPYKIDLTLSRILTQYLEELEAKE